MILTFRRSCVGVRVLKPLLLRETKVEAFSVVLRVRKKMHALFTSKQRPELKLWKDVLTMKENT